MKIDKRLLSITRKFYQKDELTGTKIDAVDPDGRAVREGETVVIFNTGSGIKYLKAF